jgi:hypothetical protein
MTTALDAEAGAGAAEEDDEFALVEVPPGADPPLPEQADNRLSPITAPAIHPGFVIFFDPIHSPVLRFKPLGPKSALFFLKTKEAFLNFIRVGFFVKLPHKNLNTSLTKKLNF